MRQRISRKRKKEIKKSELLSGYILNRRSVAYHGENLYMIFRQKTNPNEWLMIKSQIFKHERTTQTRYGTTMQ